MPDFDPDRRPERREGRDSPGLSAPGETATDLATFIRDVVDAAGAEGAVVTLDGGLGSTVAATVAVEALGSDSVYGLILSADGDPDRAVYDALHVAEELVIDYRQVDVQPLADEAVRSLTGETREARPDPFRSSIRVTTASVKPRENYHEAVDTVAVGLGNAITSFEAETTSRLVLGTENRSELLLDPAATLRTPDLLPIGDLYQTEVRELARHLDVRRAIVEKSPTTVVPTDSEGEATPVETVDAALHRLVDRDQGIETVASALAVDREVVERLARHHAAARHERRRPPTPTRWDDGSGAEYFHELELRFE